GEGPALPLCAAGQVPHVEELAVRGDQRAVVGRQGEVIQSASAYRAGFLARGGFPNDYLDGDVLRGGGATNGQQPVVRGRRHRAGGRHIGHREPHLAGGDVKE